MAARGGKRENAGRKATLKSEIIAALREQITDRDYALALQTLRFAMRQKSKNLKTAVSAAEFIIDQRIGKAPQGIDITSGGEKLAITFVKDLQ